MANPGSQQHSKNIAGPMMAQTIGRKKITPEKS